MFSGSHHSPTFLRKSSYQCLITIVSVNWNRINYFNISSGIDCLFQLNDFFSDGGNEKMLSIPNTRETSVNKLDFYISGETVLWVFSKWLLVSVWQGRLLCGCLLL